MSPYYTDKQNIYLRVCLFTIELVLFLEGIRQYIQINDVMSQFRENYIADRNTHLT